MSLDSGTDDEGYTRPQAIFLARGHDSASTFFGDDSFSDGDFWRASDNVGGDDIHQAEGLESRAALHDDDFYRKLLESYNTGTKTGCMGCRRKRRCGTSFYWPPRRSHNNYQTYANVLSFVVAVLLAISAYIIYFLFNTHQIFHSRGMFPHLTKIAIGIAAVFCTTVVCTCLCVICWWKSSSCYHYKFMGQFEDAENLYVDGLDAGEQLEEAANVVLFSQVSPIATIIENEGVDEASFDPAAALGYDLPGDAVGGPAVVANSGNVPGSANLGPSLQPTNVSRSQATRATIADNLNAFYEKFELASRSKRMMKSSENHPCLLCCIKLDLDEDALDM